MSSGSNLFQPRVAVRQICGVSPAADMPRTCSTASGRFLMIGLPPKMAWFDVIRRRRQFCCKCWSHVTSVYTQPSCEPKALMWLPRRTASIAVTSGRDTEPAP